MSAVPAERAESPRLVNGIPEGMLEYELRTAIRNYRRAYGLDAMREAALNMVHDEYDRRAPDGNA